MDNITVNLANDYSDYLRVDVSDEVCSNNDIDFS
jgi:hypothetical protein